MQKSVAMQCKAEKAETESLVNAFMEYNKVVLSTPPAQAKSRSSTAVLAGTRN